MIPPDRIIRDIEHADRFSELMRIRNYIVENARDYTDESYDVLSNKWKERFNALFDPVGCDNIERFYLYYDKGVKFKLDNAIGMCYDAKEEGVPFIEYVQKLYPDAIDAQSIIYASTERERTLAKSVLPNTQNTLQTASRIPGEYAVSINPYAVSMERLKDQIESLEGKIADLLKRINIPMEDERIKKIEATIEALSKVYLERQNEQSLEEAEPNAQSLTTTLTSAQYNAFVKSIPKRGYNNTVQRTGRGQYLVTFTFKPEQKDEVENYIRELNSVETPPGARVINPPQYDEVLHVLCRNYTNATGMACNSFNQGALKTLARRTAELLNSYGLQWDSNGVDLESVDLFAKKGERPYTAEHADEAFTQIKKRLLAISVKHYADEEETDEGECEPFALAADFARYRAITRFGADLATKDEMLPDDLLNELYNLDERFNRCGYGTNNRDLLESLASSEFDHMGMNLEDEIDHEYNRIINSGGV